MDFTQMPVSQGYKYLLVMIDTFTGWIESFPTWTQKAEEVVKNKTKQNCSMKSFQDLVCPGHYKVTMGHHLLLRSPNALETSWVTLEVNDVSLSLCNDLGRTNLRMISLSSVFFLFFFFFFYHPLAFSAWVGKPQSVL